MRAAATDDADPVRPGRSGNAMPRASSWACGLSSLSAAKLRASSANPSRPTVALSVPRLARACSTARCSARAPSRAAAAHSALRPSARARRRRASMDTRPVAVATRRPPTTGVGAVTMR